MFLFLMYFRLQKELDQTLKQAVETRWNSKLLMLQSINNALKSGKLHNVLLPRRELRFLNNIDSELLEDIIKLLTPFDEATRHLSTDKTPTLHLVLPTKATLLKGLLIQDDDSAIMKEVIYKLVLTGTWGLKIYNHRGSIWFSKMTDIQAHKMSLCDTLQACT